MNITVAYITGRQEPRLDWALESLAAQMMPGDQILFLVIDALFRQRRSDGDDLVNRLDNRLCSSLPPGLSLYVMPPKPTIWQGQHRITRQDWWAMSSSRNTALVHCRTEWIAFLDDRCVLVPTWLGTVRASLTTGDHAAARVICGAYEKRVGMANDGTGGEVTAVDNRWEAAPDGHPNCAGQWLYGCTFALPLEWALEVNGFEEGCDGQSAEDYIFGLNLANAGYRLDYDPRMKIIEDRSPGQENTYRREDKGISPNDKSHAALARFGPRKRTEFTPDLRELRALLASGKSLPIPDPNIDYKDWYDGTSIRDL
jgi:hypothetical protein